MLAKVAFSVAIVFATASGVLAATKHPIHHQHGAVAQRQAPAGTEGYSAFGSSAYGYVTPFRIARPNSGAGIGTNFLSSGCGTDGC
jgi:hypothetical protein